MGRKAIATNITEIIWHILSLDFEIVFFADVQKDNATRQPMISLIRSIKSGVRTEHAWISSIEPPKQITMKITTIL